MAPTTGSAAKLRTAHLVAAGGERSQRVAVVALAAGNDVTPLRLPDLDEILPRHFERCFDCLRSARHEIGVADALRSARDQPVGQGFGRFVGEEARMGVGKLVGLHVQGGSHVRMAVAEAGDGRAT